MTTSFRHEKLKHTLELLVEVIASELKVPVQGGGSTTFKRRDLLKGFEPDACFYIQNFERVRRLDQIDLNKDPAPDLVIEIDLTSSSLNKFPIYSALAVPEVWQHSDDGIAIFKLEGNTYVAGAQSVAFPNLTASVLVGFLQGSPDIALSEFIRVQEWMHK